MRSPTGLAGDARSFDVSFDGLPALLTIREVAKLLQISAPTVRRLQQQRDIPFVKIGGSVRFLRQDIVDHVLKQRVEVIE